MLICQMMKIASGEYMFYFKKSHLFLATLVVLGHFPSTNAHHQDTRGLIYRIVFCRKMTNLCKRVILVFHGEKKKSGIGIFKPHCHMLSFVNIVSVLLSWFKVGRTVLRGIMSSVHYLKKCVIQHPLFCSCSESLVLYKPNDFVLGL